MKYGDVFFRFNGTAVLLFFSAAKKKRTAFNVINIVFIIVNAS
jgi:hypothetical protein